MKLLCTLATALSLLSGAATAQTASDKPAQEQPPAVTLATGNENKHAREADARHCLDMKDNYAVIRCAERYRYRGAAR
jgi:hypothetical protein